MTLTLKLIGTSGDQTNIAKEIIITIPPDSDQNAARFKLLGGIAKLADVSTEAFLQQFFPDPEKPHPPTQAELEDVFRP